MKSLSLARPLVILVIGLPGSGKTFFARQFADMFNAPLISVDFIRHAAFPDSSYNATEDAVVGAIAQNELNEFLKTGKTIIIDGGVNSRIMRQSIERQAGKLGYGKLTIWVQTDEPTSLTRSVKRSGKRKFDEYNDAMEQIAFERYKKQFSIPSPTENVIVISGKHTYATQARVVLKKLVAPRDMTTVERPHTLARPEQKVEPHDIQPRRRNVTIN